MRKPDVSSVSHLRSNSRRSTPRPVFVLALGRALVLLLALSLWAPSAHAQFPRAILPSRDVTEIYTKANNIYEYGREARSYDDSLRALRASIPLYKEFLIAAPGHELAQQSPSTRNSSSPPPDTNWLRRPVTDWECPNFSPGT